MNSIKRFFSFLNPFGKTRRNKSSTYHKKHNKSYKKRRHTRSRHYMRGGWGEPMVPMNLPIIKGGSGGAPEYMTTIQKHMSQDHRINI